MLSSSVCITSPRCVLPCCAVDCCPPRALGQEGMNWEEPASAGRKQPLVPLGTSLYPLPLFFPVTEMPPWSSLVAIGHSAPSVSTAS